jgi:hypothetical protein
VGNLFVSDSENSGIRKVVLATGTVTTLAGALPKPGTVDGTGEAARFNAPVAVASDGAGSLFVGEGNTIRKVNIATGAVTTLVSSLDHPNGVACDGEGNLFVATSNHAICRVDISTGAVSTLAGSPGGFGAVDGTGADVQFRSPVGLTSDGAGNLFVAASEVIGEEAGLPLAVVLDHVAADQVAQEPAGGAFDFHAAAIPPEDGIDEDG